MNTYRDRTSLLRRLGAAVIVGTLALGASGIAAAHGSGGHARKVIHHHYHHDRHGHGGHYGHRGHGRHGGHYGHRGHGRHGHHKGYRSHKRRGYKEIHVYHHDAPVRYERPVVVEHHNYPPANTGRQASGYGHEPATPTLHAGSLMGAAIGGLIGSQIGGGTGKLAATAAGTVGGFLLGDHTTRGYR